MSEQIRPEPVPGDPAPAAPLTRRELEKLLECPLCGGLWFRGKCRDCGARYDAGSDQVVRPEPAAPAAPDPGPVERPRLGADPLDWVMP